jgi:hypothetical protein
LPRHYPFLGGRGVESRELPKILPLLTKGAFHVAAHDWATWHHFISSNEDTCQLHIGPFVRNLRYPVTCQLIVRSCHVSCMVPATSAVRPCHVSCMDCTVIKFLPVWQNGKNAISQSYSVSLNPFELRWAREVEAYAPIHFESILSTFNFEQNLIPWINEYDGNCIGFERMRECKKCVYLVSLSKITMITLFPSDFGNPVMKSMETSSQH